jgi:hypothetical protein
LHASSRRARRAARGRNKLLLDVSGVLLMRRTVRAGVAAVAVPLADMPRVGRSTRGKASTC